MNGLRYAITNLEGRPESNKKGQRKYTIWHRQRVRGCVRVRTGERPKKRPTRRGTSLGMVSLAKRIIQMIQMIQIMQMIQMGRVGRLEAIGYSTDGGGYIWDLVGGGGGVFLGFLLVVHVLDEFEDSEGDVLD